MLTVSATDFRRNLFEYLDKIAAGEVIVIKRKNKDVARVVSTQQIDWRDKMRETPKLLVSPEEFIKPLDDIWGDYV